MDAIEFLREKSRMINNCGLACSKCKLYTENSCLVSIGKHKEAVEIVEQWSKDHPHTTRQSEFLKMFPDAKMFRGAISIIPCEVNPSLEKRTAEGHCTRANKFGSCDKCRQAYWSEEIK